MYQVKQGFKQESESVPSVNRVVVYKKDKTYFIGQYEVHEDGTEHIVPQTTFNAEKWEEISCPTLAARVKAHYDAADVAVLKTIATSTRKGEAL